MARTPQPQAITLTDEARALLPDTPEMQRMLSLYATWGFARILVDEDDLIVSGPRYFVTAPLSGRDALAALEEGQTDARKLDLLARLIHACGDMRCVQETAHYLATQEYAPSTLTDPEHPISRVLLLGLVTMYCRPFTGRASLPKTWLPVGREERAMHAALMAARRAIYAHSDHTPYRGLRWNGGDALPAAFESYLSRDVFAQIAAMCTELNSRYFAEVERLFEELRDLLKPTAAQG